MIVNRKADTAQYPIVTRTMLARKRRDTLAVGDYHSAMVTLPQVTCAAVQEVFETLSTVHDADPRYLFISEDDMVYFSASLLHASSSMQRQATQIVNQSTQRLVHVISLPDLPQGTIFCGFFGA